MCQPLGRSEYRSSIRGTISSAGSGSVTIHHYFLRTSEQNSIGKCEMKLVRYSNR